MLMLAALSWGFSSKQNEKMGIFSWFAESTVCTLIRQSTGDIFAFTYILPKLTTLTQLFLLLIIHFTNLTVFHSIILLFHLNATTVPVHCQHHDRKNSRYRIMLCQSYVRDEESCRNHEYNNENVFYPLHFSFIFSYLR